MALRVLKVPMVIYLAIQLKSELNKTFRIPTFWSIKVTYFFKH
jgi:hypothetical protein